MKSMARLWVAVSLTTLVACTHPMSFLNEETEYDKTNEKIKNLNSKSDVNQVYNLRLHESKQSLHRAEWAEAIRSSSAAISIDPERPEAYASRAWAYIEKGRLEKAIADCNMALSLKNDHPEALNNRGLVYLNRNEKDEAKSDFQRACNLGLEIACNNFKEMTGYFPSEKSDFYISKSIEYFNDADWESVIEFTNKAIENDPDNEHLFAIRAGAYANFGQLDKALQDADTSIFLNPEFGLAFNNKGYVLELLDRKRAAITFYQISCDLGVELGCENLARLHAR